MPNRPTVPSDLTNESVMRAWYQALQLSVQDLFNDRLNVRDFGAYGNGVHDDTTAFNAAIAAADSQNKTVWIPKGRYKITSTITLANPITIVGDGSAVSTILPFIGAAGGNVFLITSSNVTLMDFGFDGTDTGTVTLTNNEFMIHALPTSGTINQLFIRNLRFEEFDFKAGTNDVSTESTIRAAYCIKIENTDRVIIEDCFAKNVTGGFVYTSGVNFIDINRNYLEDVMLHPICIHDTTNYFNITNNECNPTDSTGVFLGGVIEVSSATGTQCHHGNIEGNRIKGIYNSSGYVSYGAVIRVLSSTDINISNNYMTEIMDGSLNVDNDFVDLFNIKVGTYGTSSADDNGPCKRINILNNFINGSRDTNTYHFGGILVENDYQTDNLHPIEDVRIIGNQLTSTAVGTSWLERGIVISGKSSGVRDVIIEDNSVVVAPESAASGVVGRGAVSVISTDVTGKCYQIFIGGNRIENLKNDGAIATAACLTIGQYTSEAFCTKPNYLKGYSYGVVIETGAGSNLWYWDNNYYDPAGANNTKFVFNVQPTCYHTSAHGTTANRPTSTDTLVNYMTYFDTDVATPMWYNGSAWVNAVGLSTFKTTYAGDTGSVTRGPGDTLTVAGGTNISTAVSGNTLTITNTATTPAPIGASYVTLGTDATLTSERVLTAGTNVSVTDAGAGSTVTLDVTGQIPLAKGGTAANLTASNGGIFYSTGTAGAILSGTATAGQVLRSGSSAAPSWSTATYPSVATGTGTLLRADGTNWVATTSTYPNTNAVNTLLYASSANVMAALATGNSGTLVTDSGGVPSISSTLPSTVQGNITSVGTVTSGTWSASTIAVNKGGTGQTSYTDGQLLIGNTTGNTLAKATLTAGSGISVTNGSGTITIAATGGAADTSATQRSWMGI